MDFASHKLEQIMVNLPPAGTQRTVTTWAKIALSFVMVSFIAACTALGVVLAPHVTVLGVFLNARAIVQYILANLNNRRMIKGTGKVIIDAVIAYRRHRLTDEDVNFLNSLVGKKLTLDKFIGAIEHRLQLPPERREKFWKKVANSSIAMLQEQGYDVTKVIDANVPIYRVSVQELTEVLNGLIAQILPFRKIWLVLNDPDNQELREFLHQWIADRQQEVWQEFINSNGQMTEEYRDFLLGRWVLIDLKEADKRSAMTAAWLSSFGVREDQLDEFVKQLFDNPEEQLALQPPECHINLNVDSDTIASPFASWITYLSFVLFDLAGLTSNVRISNISNRFDPELPFWKGFEKWFMSWSNYFKYDFANGVERAAQSYFWCVVCMSGPWMALLTRTIPLFLGRFVNYTLRGVRIKPGDDRKATYELNRMKMRVGYHPWVVTYTDAPDNVARYCSIQDRWTMSMYANFFTSLIEGQIWLLHPWSIVDQLYAAGFTFLVMGVIVRLVIDMLVVAIPAGLGAVALPFFAILIVLNLIGSLVGALRARSWTGASSPIRVTTQIIFFVLAYALLTLYTQHVNVGLADELSNGVNTAALSVAPYLIIFVFVNLVRGLYAVWDNDGDWRGMLNTFYVVLVVRYLIPIKFSRLFIKGITPKTYRWAGR